MILGTRLQIVQVHLCSLQHLHVLIPLEDLQDLAVSKWELLGTWIMEADNQSCLNPMINP